MKTLIIILALGFCVHALDPVKAVMAAQQRPTPCYNSVSLSDSAGKPYCFICKSDTIRILLKRTMISKSELRRIYQTTEWLDTLK
jgi:hypothetical protein